MAKGSAMGLWKGKKGSSVFYQIKNSNSLQKQGVRERNYEPANPKSARQAGQRMRMYPAQAVYGVLKETIERSWQGVKYGQMTRQAYLKAALRSEFFPAVRKGDGVIVPGPYQIAKGSLGEVVAYLTETGSAQIKFDIASSGDESDTVAVLSEALLEANPFLKEGDQVTIVLCYTGDAAVTRFNWWVGSFYIDTTNDTIVANAGIRPLGLEISWDGNGLVYGALNEQFIYAAACIVSREGTTPMRSNATLAVNVAALPDYYDVNARSRAQRSYMNPLTVLETDWPVDPGEGGGTSGTISITASATNENGTVTGGGSYLPGELVSLVATPNQGYELQGWYTSLEDAEAGTNRISTAGILTFTAGDSSAFGGATTFYARFTLQG